MMQFDRAKLREAILHICAVVPADLLGAVKLHKVLYFTDMLRYAQTQKAVTGAEYRKRPFGPTCVPLLPTLRQMERDGDLTINVDDYFGFAKTDYHPHRKADLGGFAMDEVALLDEVIDFVCRRNSARTISEFSHKLPWEQASFGGVIGYDTALLLFPAEPSADAFDLVEREAADGEAARSDDDAVGRSDYRAFRSRVLSEAGTARL